MLNGGSSSGKTSIARCLQGLLPGSWLKLGVDDLIEAMPGKRDQRDLITFTPDGGVSVGPGFRRLEAAWAAGMAAMARAGVGVIVDDVFLGGGSSQARLRAGAERSRSAVGRGALRRRRGCRQRGGPARPGARDGGRSSGGCPPGCRLRRGSRHDGQFGLRVR